MAAEMKLQKHAHDYSSVEEFAEGSLHPEVLPRAAVACVITQ